MHLLRPQRGYPLSQIHGGLATAKMRHDIGEPAQVFYAIGLDFDRTVKEFGGIGVAALAHAEQAEIGIVLGIPWTGRQRLLRPLLCFRGLSLIPAQAAQPPQKPAMLGVEIQRPAEQALSGGEVAAADEIGGRLQRRLGIGRVDAQAAVIAHWSGSVIGISQGRARDAEDGPGASRRDRTRHGDRQCRTHVIPKAYPRHVHRGCPVIRDKAEAFRRLAARKPLPAASPDFSLKGCRRRRGRCVWSAPIPPFRWRCGVRSLRAGSPAVRDSETRAAAMSGTEV